MNPNMSDAGESGLDPVAEDGALLAIVEALRLDFSDTGPTQHC
jgi:hypothetical protein